MFTKTPDIAYLIELLEKGEVEIPEDVQKAKALTAYAVETRYPGDYVPVSKDDYLVAVESAEKVSDTVMVEIEAGISKFSQYRARSDAVQVRTNDSL